MSRIDKILDYSSWGLLIISMILLKLASGYVENIILGKKFVWQTFLNGFIIASLWMFILYKLKRNYFEGGEKRASAVLSQFFSIIILTIFVSTYYNYHSGKSKLYYKKAIVVDKSQNIKTSKPFLFLKMNNRRERFNPSYSDWRKINTGDTLTLTIGKGAFNYEFIYRFL